MINNKLQLMYWLKLKRFSIRPEARFYVQELHDGSLVFSQ